MESADIALPEVKTRVFDLIQQITGTIFNSLF